jgi:hypothetical protein
MKAWHFAQEDMRLGFDDGRKIRNGRTLTYKGELKMCKSGLHASKRIIDALRYARGPMICRVELGGEILHDTDKSVASERTCLWYIDGTELLYRFARMCALDVIHLWDAPDGDKSIRIAAYSAAGFASWSASRAAARATAWSAAYHAARSATWATAYSAAGFASWSASRSAAKSLARAETEVKQNKRLLRLVRKAR